MTQRHNDDVIGPVQLYKHHNKMHCSCTTRSTFFAERVVNIWNGLPCDTVDFSSLSAFKCTIERTDFSRFLCFSKFSRLRES